MNCPVHFITADLDKILQQFFTVVCKTNDENYEPESLKAMHSSIDRHLREKGYGYGIKIMILKRAENVLMARQFICKRKERRTDQWEHTH